MICGVPYSLLPSPAYIASGVCVYTQENRFSITQNQLSQTTEEAGGIDAKGRGQRLPGRSSLVIRASGAIDGIRFPTENRKLTFLTYEHPHYRL